MQIRRKNPIEIYNNQLREVEQEELETKHKLQLIQEKKWIYLIIEGMLG